MDMYAHMLRVRHTQASLFGGSGVKKLLGLQAKHDDDDALNA